MRKGRRIADPATKTLKGTFRDDRHGNIVAFVPPPAKSVPVAPSWLTDLARQVWDEELPRVIAAGATDADSGFFARYCSMSATFITLTIAGESPKAALATELRRSAELLGIAGLRSRLVKAGCDAPKATPCSPRK